MSDLANELREALDDPRRYEWGGPWEHLGDAERDVRVLLDELAAAEQQVAALREAIRHVVDDSPGTPNSVKQFLERAVLMTDYER